MFYRFKKKKTAYIQNTINLYKYIYLCVCVYTYNLDEGCFGYLAVKKLYYPNNKKFWFETNTKGK